MNKPDRQPPEYSAEKSDKNHPPRIVDAYGKAYDAQYGKNGGENKQPIGRLQLIRGTKIWAGLTKTRISNEAIGTIFTGLILVATLINDWILKPQDVEFLFRGNYVLTYGAVSYTDIFGNHHWMKFCGVRPYGTGYSGAKQCNDYNSDDASVQIR